MVAFRFRDGESDESVITRGISIIEEVIENHHEKNILIVSHGAFVKQILKVLLPKFQFEDYLQNTSITVLTKKSIGWDCELYNCTRHLSEN